MTLTKQQKLRNFRLSYFAQLERLKEWTKNFDQGLLTTHVVEAKMLFLDKVTTNFEETQGEIETIEPTNDDTEARKKFEDLQTEVMSLLLALRHKVLLNNSIPSQEHNSTLLAFDVNSGPDLPPISLPNFNGEFEEYISFKATFDSLVHDNQSRGMNDLKRFSLLRGACRGRAWDAIKHLILTPENYAVARTILENRFHRVRLIFDAHINKLFDAQPVKNLSDLRALSDLYDAEWKALGVLTEENHIGEGVLIHLALKKCDAETVRRWEEKLAQNDSNTIPRWNDFSSFLQQRCSMLESYRTTKPYYDKGFESKVAARPKHLFKSSNVASNSTVCPCCEGDCKSVSQCQKFNELNVEDRYVLAKTQNLCCRCLKLKPHTSCTEDSCSNCSRTHHSLLHFDDPVVLRSAWKRASRISYPKVTNTLAVEDIFDKEYDESLFMEHTDDTQEEQEFAINAAMTFDFSSNYTWLATALVHIKNSDGESGVFRAMLDAGSQISIISASAFQRLNLPTSSTNIKLIGVNGDAQTISKVVEIKICSIHSSDQFTVVAAVHQNLQQRHPFASTSTDDWKIPTQFKLADPEFNKSKPIDLILGADVFYKILEGGRYSIGSHLPDLIKTSLGWVIAGSMNVPLTHNACTLNSFTANVEPNSCPLEVDWMKRCWELEHDLDVKQWGAEELACQQHFCSTMKFEEGRFTVRLPFKHSTTLLGDSRQLAMSRLLNTERKMRTDDNYRKMYVEFMEEYERLGHMVEIEPPRSDEPHNYLAHFGVWKLDSTTTQLRVVFDAACATSSGRSLNDLLMVGPTVQPDLLTHLLRLRTKRYIICGDISKMYRQVLLDEEDQKYLLILWRKPGESKVKTFKLNTVTYGTACAPYQAIACLMSLAELFHDLPVGSDTIKNCMYVDDMMAGADTIDEVMNIYYQTKQLLSRGGFTLRKFQSNSQEVMQNIPSDEHGSAICIGDSEVIKTLGLNWHPEPDELSFFCDIEENSDKWTHRMVLSRASRLFDPLGLLQPLTVRAKMFIQKLWVNNSSKNGEKRSNSDWDKPLTEPLKAAWSQIVSQLRQVNSIKIPRYAMAHKKIKRTEIHGFCDASEGAYAAALYILSLTEDGQVEVKLWCAKTRLAPLKTISIARLELCAALLLAELYSAVSKRCPVSTDAVHLWTDSMITYAWIQSSPHLRVTFVANRVTKIQDLTTNCTWHHVPGELNSADIASRGATLEQLDSDSVWFNGPKFLYLGENHWPQTPAIPNDLPESKQEKLSFHVQIEDDLVTKIKFENYSRVRRTMAFVGRFMTAIAKGLRKSHPLQNFIAKLPQSDTDETFNHEIVFPEKIGKKKINCLSVAELKTGEILAVKVVQQVHYKAEINTFSKSKALPPQHHLVSLSPFLDEFNLIRVGGRLNNCEELSYNEKHQLLLPPEHPFTHKLFRWTHERILHGGPNAIMAAIRMKFWVPRGRYLANRALKRCTFCFRMKPKVYQYVMGNYPKDRVTTVPVAFANSVGVDYCGPFTIHYKGRGSRPVTMYLAIFVCFSTKAVHLEMVEDLSTAAFINTLRRFVNKRGLPQRFWSDNATNFKGAARILAELMALLKTKNHWTTVYEWCTSKGVEWSFIPPRSPHFGGLWEAAVKSAKHHILRVAGSAPLTHDEMITLLSEVEKCLNNRPLIPLSNNPKDNKPLTPAHFIILRPFDQIPEPNLVDQDPSALQRYERVIAVKQQFERSWKKDYLHTLQHRYKWSNTGKAPQLDDMVLLVQQNVPSRQWKLGRIVKLYPGSDNVSRVVDVKTSTGIFKRSITELCPLPIEETD